RLWGKAGQRSMERSALFEAAEQLRRALDQIALSPATPALRREQIKFQVALIMSLIPLKGHAARETMAAMEQAHLFIAQAEALGESPEDPLLLFYVLYGFWVANFMAFNGDMIRKLAAQFFALAKKQGATVPLIIGHRLMANAFTITGDIAKGRAHYDKALALYDPAEHRALAMRFGQDAGVTAVCHRSWPLFCLGYPHAALTDAENALKDARQIGHPVTLMVALVWASFTQIQCGNYVTGNALVDELVSVAHETGSSLHKATGTTHHGWLLALTGKASEAVHMLTSGLNEWRATRTTVWVPFYLSYLARAYADSGSFDDASRCIGEAIATIETTNERLWKAEVQRVAGEVALMSPEPDAAKAQDYFERSLAVARAQQAKSWELRAAMSMARLWREQGKRNVARDLLAPVYGWFTEGFDTLDLKQAKRLLDELTP